MVVALVENLPRIEEHGPFADVGKFMLNLVAFKLPVLGRDLLKQSAQAGNIPLAVAQCVEQPSLRLLAVHSKSHVEGAAGRDDAQVTVEHQRGFAHRIDDGLRKRERANARALVLLPCRQTSRASFRKRSRPHLSEEGPHRIYLGIPKLPPKDAVCGLWGERNGGEMDGARRHRHLGLIRVVEYDGFL